MRTGTAPWLFCLCVMAACGDSGGDGAPESASQRFARPSVKAMLVHLRAGEQGGLDRDEVSRIIEREWASPAARSFWAAVERASERGLRDLYAIETFHGLGGYEVVALLRTTSKGVCLYGNSEWHESRDDPNSIPYADVGDSALEQVARRVRPHIPPERKVSLAGEEKEGALVLIHILQDGVPTSLLRYAPASELPFEESLLSAFQRDYEVDALRRAIYASVPDSILPPTWETGVNRYSELPGFE